MYKHCFSGQAWHPVIDFGGTACDEIPATYESSVEAFMSGSNDKSLDLGLHAGLPVILACHLEDYVMKGPGRCQ